MNSAADQPKFSGSQKIYALLLRAYPRRHRKEYGAAMAQLFRDQCRDAWAEAGNWGMTKLWLRVLPDVASTSITERLTALKERKIMNDKITNLNEARSTSPTTIFLTIFTAVFLITVIIATAITFILPESYASTCKLKVENDQPTTNNYSYDPYFIQTTFEIINSSLVLSNVVAKQNLTEIWNRKYFKGMPIKATEAVEILRGRIALSPVKNTQLIAITAYSDDKNEAARIANAVAEAYKEYRVNLRTGFAAKGLEILEQAYSTESDQISAMRKDVELYGQTNAMLEKYKSAMTTGEKSWQEHNQTLLFIKAADKQRLRNILPSVAEDQTLIELSSKLREAELNYATLTNALPDSDLKVVMVKARIGQLESQIDARAAGVTAGLEEQVSSQRVSLDVLAAKIHEAKLDEAAKLYPAKKEKFDEMLRAHEMLFAKIKSEKLDARIPKAQMVQVTDPAEPSRTPVKPNKTLDIVFGVMMGIILGTLAGGVAVWVATRRGNRAPKNAPSV